MLRAMPPVRIVCMAQSDPDSARDGTTGFDSSGQTNVQWRKDEQDMPITRLPRVEP